MDVKLKYIIIEVYSDIVLINKNPDTPQISFPFTLSEAMSHPGLNDSRRFFIYPKYEKSS